MHLMLVEVYFRGSALFNRWLNLTTELLMIVVISFLWSKFTLGPVFKSVWYFWKLLKLHLLHTEQIPTSTAKLKHF